jgi:hypothetical protein
MISKAKSGKILQERTDMLNSHRADLEKLGEKLDAMEDAFMQSYLKTAESFQMQYDAQRCAETDELNQLKMR